MINVIDSPVGAGKTSWAIAHINSMREHEQVIYITPYLTEVERIIRSCPDLHFVQPDARLGKGSKRNHLLQLVMAGNNIVSTHALFSAIDDEMVEALRSKNYVLYLDEAMNVIERFDMYDDFSTRIDVEKATIDDIRTLSKTGIISVDEGFQIRWTDPNQPLHKYQTLKRLADRGLLYLVHDNFLMWSFPIEVFMDGIFDEIFIMTYMFDAQMQRYYYDFFGLKYTKYHVVKDGETYSIAYTDNLQYEVDWINEIGNYICLYEGDLNKIGGFYVKPSGKTCSSALSRNWYRQYQGMHPLVSDCMEKIFRRNDFPAEDRLWTCFKDDVKSLSNKKAGAKQWLELTARATNDFGTKKDLVYLVNRFINPFYAAFFEKRGVKVDSDAFALSEMVQWIFRSAIRNNQRIDLFIPSERMRTLLKNWLDGENIFNIFPETKELEDD